MSNSNTELYKALLSGSSIDEIIRKEIEDTIDLPLKTELTSFLDYEPYDAIRYNSVNLRNGSYSRNLKTKYGELLLRFLETVMVSLNNIRLLHTNVIPMI